MPKTNPFSRASLNALPPRLLNSVFPTFRLVFQVVVLLIHTLMTPIRRLLASQRPPSLAAEAVRLAPAGRVTHVSASWAGGVPKHPRRRAFLTRLGVLGDRQRSEWIASWGGHGGVDKAVCLFDLDIIERLASQGHDVSPGALGEQVTLAGLPWQDCAAPGARIRLGSDVLLEISEYTSPCGNIKHAFKNGQNNLVSKNFPGCSRWYAKVLSPGWVKPGDQALLLRMPSSASSD